MTFEDPDIAALVGGEPTPVPEGPTRRKFGGRPKGSKNKPKPMPHPFMGMPLSRRAEQAAERIERAAALLGSHAAQRRDDDPEGVPTMDMTDVFGGVTVGWLSKVFGMDPSTVKKRLADCPPLHRRKAGYTYSLPVACRYLVKPVFDVKKYLEEMSPSELPANLQKEYWDALLKRQTWETRAGHLWPSESVMEVFGETFKTIKFTTQLWADNLQQLTGLTNSQRKILTDAVDGLHKELHERLLEMPKKRQTPSLLHTRKDPDEVSAETPVTDEFDGLV